MQRADFFDMYVKSSTLSNERKKNKWALPSVALERHFGPVCAIFSWAPDGSAHLFVSLIR